MTTTSEHTPAAASDRWLHPMLRGIFLLFDKREGPRFDARAGLRLLVIVLVLELVIGPRAHILQFLGLPPAPDWLRIGTLLVEALVAVRLWANVRFGDIGFLSPTKWTATERWYFAEVVVVAGIAFFILRGASLGLISGDSSAWIRAAVLLGPQILWGFYQEVIYRGLLQSELTRRFGAIAGVLIANLAFTFGPLHFYHLANMKPETMNATLIVMAAVFGIGLLFGFIFHRTRNMWLVGVMHGVGNAFTNIST